jgi:hypothetical protein
MDMKRKIKETKYINQESRVKEEYVSRLKELSRDTVILARGFNPYLKSAFSLTMRIAEAPSETWLAAAALIRPPSTE